ncbi:hypothetical protein FRB95_005000 [Tulasnella sp. JGI-2019a]|nr:hypothetical protein FRB95_005000 [Tulasnella sp. JGI-2019a]
MSRPITTRKAIIDILHGHPEGMTKKDIKLALKKSGRSFQNSTVEQCLPGYSQNFQKRLSNTGEEVWVCVDTGTSQPTTYQTRRKAGGKTTKAASKSPRSKLSTSSCHTLPPRALLHRDHDHSNVASTSTSTSASPSTSTNSFNPGPTTPEDPTYVGSDIAGIVSTSPTQYGPSLNPGNDATTDERVLHGSTWDTSAASLQAVADLAYAGFQTLLPKSQSSAFLDTSTFAFPGNQADYVSPPSFEPVSTTQLDAKDDPFASVPMPLLALPSEWSLHPNFLDTPYANTSSGQEQIWNDLYDIADDTSNRDSSTGAPSTDITPPLTRSAPFGAFYTDRPDPSLKDAISTPNTLWVDVTLTGDGSVAQSTLATSTSMPNSSSLPFGGPSSNYVPGFGQYQPSQQYPYGDTSYYPTMSLLPNTLNMLPINPPATVGAVTHQPVSPHRIARLEDEGQDPLSELNAGGYDHLQAIYGTLPPANGGFEAGAQMPSSVDQENGAPASSSAGPSISATRRRRDRYQGYHPYEVSESFVPISRLLKGTGKHRA